MTDQNLEFFTLRSPVLERMTDDEFFEFCQINKTLLFERSNQGEIIIMSPTGGKTDLINTTIIGQLFVWHSTNKTGKIFGSSAGFILPDSSIYSPDACWVSEEQWAKIAEADKEKFLPVCPEFVIELQSPSDSSAYLANKMAVYMANGTKLAWLINPKSEEVRIYRAGQSFETLKGFEHTLSGEDILPDFTLVLETLKI